MLTHVPCYIARRKTTGPWLVEDVEKTADASALAMLKFFTLRIMSPDSQERERPNDILERIVDKIGSEVTNAAADHEYKNPVTRTVEKMMRAHKEL